MPKERAPACADDVTSAQAAIRAQEQAFSRNDAADGSGEITGYSLLKAGQSV